MAEKTVPAPEGEQAVQATREPSRYQVPAVDIYESTEGLCLTADMPGVQSADLDVRVDDGVLTISAPVSLKSPGQPGHQEFELVHYFRQFELGDKVHTQKISAVLKHGVLTLLLPRSERLKPREIKVQVG